MSYMMFRLIISICLFFTLLLAACQQDVATSPPTQIEILDIQITGQPGPAPTLEHYVFKTSEPGTVSIHGLLNVMDPMMMLPDPNDAIFLVPLELEGAGPATIPNFVVGEVPQADVDERNGEFMFTNIQPGRYAVIVLTISGSQIPARTFFDGNLAIITVEDSDRGDTIELGDLSLP